MAPCLALSRSNVLARNLATSLQYSELPQRFTDFPEGNLVLPKQSKAVDADLLLFTYHLVTSAYNGGRRFLPQLNEYALHAAWALLCTKLASLSPSLGKDEQLRSALIPGEAADRLGVDPAAGTPTSSPAREGAGSKGSHGSLVGSAGAAAALAGPSAQPTASAASSALNHALQQGGL